MKLFLPIFFFAATLSHADFNEQVQKIYPETVKIVEKSFPGDIAKDMSKYAVCRCIHEDGNKPDGYSVPGLSCGGWNKEMLDSVIKRLNLFFCLGRVSDSEGACMITIKGEKANVISAATIAHLFNYYIHHLGFKEEDRIMWRKAVVFSYIGSAGSEEYQNKYEEMKPFVEKTLKRCNGMYGPGSDRINNAVKGIQ